MKNGKCRATIAVLLAALSIAALPGCESSQDRKVRGLMWYRAPAKPPLRPTSFAVGRYGGVAEYGSWNRVDVSSDGREMGGSATGRTGSTAEYSTVDYAGVGGQPTGTGAGYGRTSGTSMSSGVAGGTARVGESGEGGASYGKN